MELSSQIIESILNADSKALATNGKHGLNVVPVSAIRIIGGKIWLMNFFFKKTRDNIMGQSKAALVCWKGAEGYQIKGSVEYTEQGSNFETARQWIAENLPHRTLKGLLILQPEQIFRVSPSHN